MMERLTSWLDSFFIGDFGFIVAYLLIFVGMSILCLAANHVAKKWLLSLVTALIRRSKNTYDDVFLEKGVFQRMANLAPAMVVSGISPFIFSSLDQAQLLGYIDRGVTIYLTIVGGLIFSAVLSAFAEIYDRHSEGSVSNLKGFIQALRIILVFIIAILIVAQVTGHTPKYLLGGLGALTAVILLIFKDTLLGFVAGIQLAFNKMVQIGDWVTVPFAEADGDVVDITLTTVKIQNWDKTISHVPIYSLTTNSFTNWRGMSESGGRRIKRSLHLDMNTVRFCDDVLLKKMQGFRLLKEYLNEKITSLQDHHKKNELAPGDLINSRRLTNLGTFRAYVTAYLRQNENIHKEMTFLVRYLPVTPKGLPMEIYVFSKDQRWAFYEDIQADIIDHLLAIMPEFELSVFQDPSGQDFRRMGITK